MPSITDRLKHGWNAFMGRSPTKYENYGPGYSYRPDRTRIRIYADKSIIATVQNRIAVDVSAIDIEHVRVDENDNFIETIKSGLNEVLKLDANADQTGRAFMQDVCQTMFDDGVVAIVPVETDINPALTGGYDITNMRVGHVVTWYPHHVTLKVFNEETGRKEDITLPKKVVAIVENPFYQVMNEPNSTAQRLMRTLASLDAANENNASGKLDMIIQLPYVIKNQSRREQAEKRRKDIEMQLTSSKYGIAYTDGTERITQLNRAVENTLWTQVKELQEMLFNQLGLTPSIFNGTATQEELLNYYSRTIDPIVSAITDEMERKFLTKTARTKGHAIKYFRDPFRLVSVGDLASIADRFIANEILTSNEIRAIMGYKPVDTARANALMNKNINTMDAMGMPLDDMAALEGEEAMPGEMSVDEFQNEEEIDWNSLEQQLLELLKKADEG